MVLSTLSLRLWIPLILLALSPAFSATDVATDQEALTGIYVKADDSEYDYDTQQFRAEGNAFVRYNDLTLTADRVSGNAFTGDFEARGNVTFAQGEREVKGSTFVYNYKTKIGHFADASASADGFYFHGETMDSKPEGYTLTDSTFTTCNRAVPHYYLFARELIIRPNDKLIARGVRIVAFGRTLVRVPRYSVGLREGRRSGMKVPSVGVSARFGTYIAHDLDFSSRPGMAGKFSIRLSTEQAFQGGFKLDRVAGKPVYLNLTYREPYYGGRTSDTMLTRMPELSYRFYSKGTPRTDDARNESLNIPRRVLDPMPEDTSLGRDLRTFPRGRVHIIGEAGIGHFSEEPSGVESTRVDLRALAWFDPVHVGNTMLMPGVLARVSHYGTGDSYLGLGFQFAAARKLGLKSYVSLTYITHAITGKTPFDFDPIEVPQEFAGRLQYPIGDYTFAIGGRYDISRGRLFDSEVSVSKVFHCVESTFTWRNRFQEFGLDVRVVGF